MKLNRLCAVAAGVLILSSCNDLLEKKPLVTLAVENYYTTEEEAKTALMGIYHVFMSENFGLYHYLHPGDNISDDSQLGNSRSDGVAWQGTPSRSFSSITFQRMHIQVEIHGTRIFR